MTTDELKIQLNEISSDYYKIIEVLFYIQGKSRLVVVVYETNGFGNKLESWGGSSIEKAIMRFADEKKANLMSMDGGSSKTRANSRIEYMEG